eukprot:4003934-Pleurochrysis_carterae.AAC.9
MSRAARVLPGLATARPFLRALYIRVRTDRSRPRVRRSMCASPAYKICAWLSKQRACAGRIGYLRFRGAGRPTFSLNALLEVLALAPFMLLHDGCAFRASSAHTVVARNASKVATSLAHATHAVCKMQSCLAKRV